MPDSEDFTFKFSPFNERLTSSFLKSDGSFTLKYTSPGELKELEKNVSREWHVGDNILSLYEVKGILGRGSFGTVYKVRHMGWNIDIAVKSLNPELMESEKHKTDFLKECQGWVNLGLHPNIVTCYYVRELGGLPRIFLEFMEGGSLSGWIKNKKIKDMGQIIDLSIQCLDGLFFAHGKGLIHRDIKPLNCLLTETGFLKITDFGIASGLLNLLPKNDGELEKTMVAEGGVVGTPAYMPPEQWDRACGTTGPWSDIYAFGVMLYELCCGIRPFDKGVEHYGVLKFRHLTEEPEEPIRINSDIPQSLSNFILKCLRKKPEERFQDCQSARNELVAIYNFLSGRSYNRARPQEVRFLADAMNNRAVSLMDLGLKEDALKVWEDVRKIDYSHLRANFNYELTRWRSGIIDDQDFFYSLNSILNDSTLQYELYYFLGLFHMERNDCESALECFEKSLKLKPDNKEVLRLHEEANKNLSKSARLIKIINNDKNVASHMVVIGENKRWAMSCSSWFKNAEYFDLKSSRMDMIEYGVKQSLSSEDMEENLKASFFSNSISLINLFSWKVEKTMEDNSSEVTSIAISGNSGLTGHMDGNIKLWDLKEGKIINVFKGHSRGITSLSIYPDIKSFISCGRDNVIHLWNDGNIVRSFTDHASPVVSSYLMPPYLLTGSNDGIIKFRDYSSELVKTVKDDRLLTSVSFSLYGNRFATLSDNEIKIFEFKSGLCISSFNTGSYRVKDIYINNDGTFILTIDPYYTIKLWNIAQKRCVRTFEIPYRSGILQSLAFSNDGTMALAGLASGDFYVFSISAPFFASEYALSHIGTIEKIDEVQSLYFELISKTGRFIDEKNWLEVIPLLSKAVKLPGYEHEKEIPELISLASEKAMEDNSWPWAFKLLSQGRALPNCDRYGNLPELWKMLYSIYPKKSLKIKYDMKTFEGHGAGITSSLFINNTLSISSSKDGIIKLWDIDKDECLKTIETYNSCIVISCGEYIISGHEDGKIKLWDLSSGIFIKSLEGHSKSITALCCSYDFKWLLSGSMDNNLRLWDINSGMTLRTMECSSYIKAISLSNDMRFAFSGDNSKSIKIWDIETGNCRKTINIDTKKISISFKFSHDNKYCFACEGDILYLYEFNYDKPWDYHVRTGKHSGNHIKSATFTFDGKWIFLYGGKALYLYDVKKLERLEIFDLYENTVTFDVNPAGSYIFSGTPEGKLSLIELDWYLEVPEKEELDEGFYHYLKMFLDCHTPYYTPSKDNTHNGNSVSFIKYGNPLWTENDFFRLRSNLSFGGYGWIKSDIIEKELGKLAEKREHFYNIIEEGRGKGIKEKAEMLIKAREISEYKFNYEIHNLWKSLYVICRKTDISDVYFTKKFNAHNGNISSLSLSDNGIFVSNTYEKNFKIWDMEGSLKTIECDSFVRKVIISHDGKHILSYHGEGLLKLWDDSGACLDTMDTKDKDIYSMFLTDNLYIFTSGTDGTIKMWHRRKSVRSFKGHSARVQSIDISRDGQRLISGSLDKSIKLWYIKTGKCLQTMEGHMNYVNSVVFSGDGKSAFSVDTYGTVILWNLLTGKAIKTMGYYLRNINKIQMTFDGKWAIFGGNGCAVVNIETGKAEYLEVTDPVMGLQVSPDGSFILIADGNTIKVWRPDWKLELPEPAEWPEEIYFYIENFVSLIISKNKPLNDNDFQELLNILSYAGYGWLNKEDVRQEFHKMLSQRKNIFSKIFGFFQ